MIGSKGIMGIGMLMIFISTVLASAIAAGVLIRSTGLLQERALLVGESAQNRLISGVEVFGVYANGDTAAETIKEFEFMTRVRAGSPPIQMKTLGISFVSSNVTAAAILDTSLIGSGCTFSALEAETNYCFENRLGNNDTVLEEGEMYTVKFKLDNANALSTEEDFEITLTPKTGAMEVINLRTPELIMRNKIRLR